MKKHRRKSKRNKLPQGEQEPTEPLSRRVIFAVPAGLAVFLMTVYLCTLLPGVNSGDSAELQYAAPLLGICHPPGYQIEVTFGKLFSVLPIGPSIAWRINLMMALFGTIGCVALYDGVRRVTGKIIPGLVAATTLGFSSIYWIHCLYAEAYVFYSTFLLLAFWAATRFVQSDKALWLYLAAIFAGLCVADRASELFVMPAVVVLWLFVRKKIHLSPLRIIVAAVIFVLPFVYTISFFMIRTGPEHLHERDSAWRNCIVAGKPCPPDPAPYRNLRRAFKQCLGLNYTKDASFNADRLGPDIDKYAWLLSGFGGFGDRYPAGDRRLPAQGSGSSIGMLGLFLALGALLLGRGRYGWVLFGFTMFVGNCVFILWHSRWDSLTFTIPGLAGLAILTGLGASALTEKLTRRSAPIFGALCLAAPIFLLVTNWRYVDMSGPEQKALLEKNMKLADAPLPADSVILDTYWPAMTYRYIIYIEASRTDVQVLYAEQKKWDKIIKYFNKNSRPVFIRTGHLNPQMQSKLTKLTHPQIVRAGFLQINPNVTVP